MGGHGPLFFHHLQALQPQAARTLIKQLSSCGFSEVTLTQKHNPELVKGLQVALQEAATLTSFRFPPMGDTSGAAVPIRYNPSQRQAMETLFAVVTTCLRSLLMSSTTTATTNVTTDIAPCNSLLSALDQVEQILDPTLQNEASSSLLFSSNPNEPFVPGQAFSHSFFNLFNYNHGSLNIHKDRSLLTVIVSHIPPNNNNRKIKQSALWIQDYQGEWHNADKQTVTEDIESSSSSSSCRSLHQEEDTGEIVTAVILVGEDFVEQAPAFCQAHNLFAASHAVRVDPTGPLIARSHYRRDPDTLPANSAVNLQRVSAALILRHEETQ